MALALAGEGLNPCQVARATGIPRSTICGWIAHGAPGGKYGRQRELGDGHISELKRTFRLRVFMDSRYPGIIGEVFRSMRAVIPGHKVDVRRVRPHNLVVISVYSGHLPRLFPQHGPGRKHHRAIVLAPWQEDIVEEHTGLFLRGLIQSDGCRVINKVWGGRY